MTPTPKLVIGIDLDSCLNTLDEAWCKWIQATIDPTFTIQKWTQWGVHNLVKTPDGKPNLRVYDFVYLRGAFANLDVQPGAQEVVACLERDGHSLHLVSNSHPEVIAEKHKWIEKFFGDTALADHNKQIWTGCKSAVKLDVLIDDGMHNFVGFPGEKIVMLKPWNQAEALATYGYRVKSDWPGVTDHIIDIMGIREAARLRAEHGLASA
jgi:5'(3')-deoxyribonucleotidase